MILRVACVALLAQSAPSPPATMDVPTSPRAEPRIERLENGLRIIIVENHTLPLVSVQLWYRAGSALDEPNRPGMCHVARTILEHRRDAAIRLRAAGVRFQSRTLRDACCFDSFLLPEQLDYVLEIEAQRMALVDATAEELAAARGAAARTFDDPPEEFEWLEPETYRRLCAAAFPDCPYQHPPGIVAAALADVPVTSVNEFLQRWFVPANATLFIIGDAPEIPTLDKVRELFGRLPWREPPRRAEFSVPEKGRVDAVRGPGDAERFDIAWVTPPAGYFENAAIDVLVHQLCNPVDGPLHRHLIDAGWSAPRWERRAWRDGGLLVLSALRDPTRGQNPSGEQDRSRERERAAAPLPAREGSGEGQQPTAFPDLVIAELERAAATIPSEVELNRARALAARDVLDARASLHARALKLAAHEIIGGDILLGELDLPRVRGISAADVGLAASLLLEARTITCAPGAAGPATAAAAPTEPEPVALLPAEAAQMLDPPEVIGLLMNFAPVDLATTASGEAPANRPGATTQDTSAEPRLPVGVRISQQMYPTGLMLRVVTIAGAEVATVRTHLPGAERWISVLPLVGIQGLERDRLDDYLSYRGVGLTAQSDGARGALVAVGPADQTAQMIELEMRLLFQPDLTPETLARAQRDFSASFRRGIESPARFAARLAEHAAQLADPPPDFESVRAGIERFRKLRPAAQSEVGRAIYLVDVVGPASIGDASVALARVLDALAADSDSRESIAPAIHPELAGDEVAAGARPRILWAPGAADRIELQYVEGPSMWISIGEWRPGTLPRSDGPLFCPDFDRFSPGLPGATALSASAAPRWRFGTGPLSSAIAAARVPPSALEPARESLRRVWGPTILADPVEGYRQHVWRTARLLALDGPGGIADAVGRNSSPPWNVRAAQLRKAGFDELQFAGEVSPRNLRDVIIVVGGDESLRPTLEKFGEVRVLNTP